jgi:8-oxo-dGTP pyrophosphatase MutT (NUDIX family)
VVKELRRNIYKRIMENDTVTQQQIICSGGLFLAKDTGRFLLLLRNNGKTAGTWGLVGGKKEPSDVTAYDALNREISEEVGVTPKIRKTIPLELFTSNDQQFQYNTYVLMIDKEFIPTLNDEHSGYAWCSFDQWPKPLHQGVKNSFSNKAVRAKLELLLDLLN